MKRTRARRDIFTKLRLTPGQLRAVAEYRFDDAMCLYRSKDKRRATGAMYMAGFVIECLLKALLLERHPNLGLRLDPAKLSVQDREIFEMLFSHELDQMLKALPEVEVKLLTIGQSAWTRFRDVCEEWTIYARYSPRLATPEEAGNFSTLFVRPNDGSKSCS